MIRSCRILDEPEEISKHKMSLPVKLYHPTLLRCTVVKKGSKQSPTFAKKDGERANRMKDLYGSADAMCKGHALRALYELV